MMAHALAQSQALVRRLACRSPVFGSWITKLRYVIPQPTDNNILLSAINRNNWILWIYAHEKITIRQQKRIKLSPQRASTKPITAAVRKRGEELPNKTPDMEVVWP